MFNFGLYGLKLAADDILDFGVQSSEQPVYRLLCIDYLKFFLPLDNSASMILPQLQFNVLSSIPNQKLCTNPRYVVTSLYLCLFNFHVYCMCYKSWMHV